MRYRRPYSQKTTKKNCIYSCTYYKFLDTYALGRLYLLSITKVNEKYNKNARKLIPNRNLLYMKYSKYPKQQSSLFTLRNKYYFYVVSFFLYRSQKICQQTIYFGNDNNNRRRITQYSLWTMECYDWNTHNKQRFPSSCSRPQRSNQ